MAELDTTPYWLTSTTLPRFAPLDRDLQVDVVVIGGGITGITAAYLLKQAGRTVALLDRGRAAGIDTGHTTAHLTCVTDTRLTELVEYFGEDHATAVWDAGFAAIAQIDDLVRTQRIDCHFAWVSGYLHAPIDASASDANAKVNANAGADIDALREEAELIAKLGFDARFVDRIPLMNTPGIEIDGQARFHPLKYLSALLARIHGDGSYVFEHTNADEVRDDPLAVVAAGHTIACRDVVVATHYPIVGKASVIGATLLDTKLAHYTSYVVGGRVPAGTVPDALFWDTADPYHYLRLDRGDDGGEYVIYGGEDHKTGQADDTRECFSRLERALSRLIPGVAVTHRWSGQVVETNDGLPFIGEMVPHQFTATGFAGNGMTFGTLGGMMARDAILDRPNPWRELFDVGRTKIRGGLYDYLAENKDYPYYLIRDRFAGAQGRSLRTLRRGEGRLLELDGDQVAAYRDHDGAVTRLSAICTHMACRVAWNTAERTWDCPCHGSRFAPTGEVIAGPAERPLASLDRREEASKNLRAAGHARGHAGGRG